MVVLLAIRLAVALKEVLGAQLLAAVVAGKVFRVPGLAQGRDHLANNRLLAGIAAALLCGRHSSSAHVLVQIAEHRVQLVSLGQGARRRLSNCLNRRHSLVWPRVVCRHSLQLMTATVAVLVTVAVAVVSVVHLECGRERKAND